MLTKSFLIWAMLTASNLSGLPAPNEVPVVKFRSSAMISGITNNENAVAFYDPATNTVTMPRLCQEMESLECKGFLIHELVHYLQDVNGRFENVTCVPSLEGLAYETEDKFLKANGSSLAAQGLTPAMIASFGSCGNEYEQNE